MNDVTAVRVFGRCHGCGRGRAAGGIIPVSLDREFPCPISHYARPWRDSVPPTFFSRFTPASSMGKSGCLFLLLFNLYSQPWQVHLLTLWRRMLFESASTTIRHMILTFSRHHAYSSMAIQKVPPSVSYRGPTHLFGSCPDRRRFPAAPGRPASSVLRAGIKRGPKPAHFSTTTRPHGNPPVRSVRFLGRGVATGPQACA